MIRIAIILVCTCTLASSLSAMVGGAPLAGAPVYREIGGALAVIGVVSWSTGPSLSDGCGGLTGVTPLMRYRVWIVEQALKMGSVLPP